MTVEDGPRIAVFVCKCGANINGVIDCKAVCDHVSSLPGVVISTISDYLCSDANLKKMKETIRDSDADRVVVAACSPRLHHMTFKHVLEEMGINRNMLHMSNIREQCAWVHMGEKEKATEKAKDLVEMGVIRARGMTPIEERRLPLNQDVLVIGGGVAGVEAAYSLGELGHTVHLVERKPILGGNMAASFTCLLWCHEVPGRKQDISLENGAFPACDCSGCSVSKRLYDLINHPNIQVHTMSQVEMVSGHAGDFKVKISTEPRYVDAERCVGCGFCTNVCPVETRNEYDYGLSTRKAIYIPYKQGVPPVYLIDRDSCLRFKGDDCHLCYDACEFNAPNLEEKKTEAEINVGAIIIATGFDPYEPAPPHDLGYGRFDNVITIMQLERMLDKAGPTNGKVIRPSDDGTPRKIAFIQCVGARDRKIGSGYCSGVCCMYTMKNAQAIREAHPDSEITVYYMDIRAVGKGVEEFYHRTREDYGVKYIRGRPAKIEEDPENNNLVITAEETLLNKITRLSYDMVVLSVSLTPPAGMRELAEKFRLRLSPDGFIQESHTRMKPMETPMEGVYVAGCAQGAKDVPNSVAQARGAAMEVAILLGRKEKIVDSGNIFVEEEKCIGCGVCLDMCPYGAPVLEMTDRGLKAKIRDALCRGGGTCVAACPEMAIINREFTNEQIIAEIIGVLKGV